MKEYRLHGPPGTGKTTALSTVWVPKAADRFGGDAVVICSLTRTAAAEIASREVPLPKENVGTLHALAYRALGRPEIAETRLGDWNESEPMYALGHGMRPSVDLPEIPASGAGNDTAKGDALMARAQVLRHQRVKRDAWPSDVLHFQRRWENWCDTEGLVDFTGLIERALDDCPIAPGAPQVLIIDEAQDCSVLELQLVRSWASQAAYVVLAGDGDQAIYGWRGASARAFLSSDIPEDHNYHLKQSYRVPKAVHSSAVRWIEQASYRYAVDYQPRDYEGEVVPCIGSSRNAEPLIDSIAADLEADRSVMVLATCGYMLNQITAKLQREGMVFHNPFREHHSAWNPLSGSLQRVLEFLRPEEAIHGGNAGIWTWAEADRWVEFIKSKGVLKRGAKTKVKKYAKDEEKANEFITESDAIEVFGEHAWKELHQAFRSGDPLDWLKNNLMPAKTSGFEYAFAIADKHGRAKLIEEPKIVVGTIHSVKGGQADSVYLIPDLSPSSMREWSGGKGDSRDGIIRTFYVGMTRAKERLNLCRRWSPQSIDFSIAR